MSSNHPGNSSAGLGTAQPFLPALGTLAWDPGWGRGRDKAVGQVFCMFGLALSGLSYCEMDTITIMAASHLESARKSRSWALPVGHSLW